jgi:hypothetical protein
VSDDYENLGELPRSYGRPVLFGIARDPRTLFVYWDINWPEVFGNNPPSDRKVRLRVLSGDGIEETSTAVEPMAGTFSIGVLHPRNSYRIEIGFHEPAGVWNSVAISEPILTPPEAMTEDLSIDVATVPFHMSFQRMIDAFRATKYDGDALVEIVGRLQQHADDPAAVSLSDTDRELLRTIDSGLSEAEALHRSLFREATDAFTSRQQIEAILGFGASSPANGFGNGSRA